MTTNLFSIGAPVVNGRPGAEPAATPAVEGDLSTQSSFLPMFLQMLFAQHAPTANSAAAVDGVAIPIEQLEILDLPVDGAAAEPTEPVNALTLLSAGKSHMPVTLLQSELLQRDNQLHPKIAKMPVEPPVAAPLAAPLTEETGEIVPSQSPLDIPVLPPDRTPLRAAIEIAPEPSIPATETPLGIRESKDIASKTPLSIPAAGTIDSVPQILFPSVKTDNANSAESVEAAAVPLQHPQPEKNERLAEKKSIRKEPTGKDEAMEQGRSRSFDEPVVSAAGHHTDDGNGSDSRHQDRPAAEPVQRIAGTVEPKEFQRTLNGVDSLALRPAVSAKELTAVSAPITAPMKPEMARAVLEQITGGVTAALREGASEMKLVLRPEHLGEVTVRVQVDDGKVTATMDVQQVQVKQTIELNMPQLREALSQKGLTMERIEINAAQNGMADETAQHRHEESRQRFRRNAFVETEENEFVKLYGYNTVEYTM